MLFEKEADRKLHIWYYLPKVRVKKLQFYDWWKSLFDQSVKSNMRAYHCILKISTNQWDERITGCFLDYDYLNNYCKMIAIDLSKQQVVDADPKAIQQIHFTGNLHRDEHATMFVIIKLAKETVLDFPQGTVKVL